jgi:hypothetical protein
MHAHFLHCSVLSSTPPASLHDRKPLWGTTGLQSVRCCCCYCCCCWRASLAPSRLTLSLLSSSPLFSISLSLSYSIALSPSLHICAVVDLARGYDSVSRRRRGNARPPCTEARLFAPGGSGHGSTILSLALVCPMCSVERQHRPSSCPRPAAAGC